MRNSKESLIHYVILIQLSAIYRDFFENFKSALPCILRQPKLEALKDCSILELYILVCMKRLEVKELELCNFNSVMKEYESIHNTFQTSDRYARNVCLRAFEHLLERALISFEDNRGHGQSPEFRPVKLLISWHELHQGLKSHHSCPVCSNSNTTFISAFYILLYTQSGNLRCLIN